MNKLEFFTNTSGRVGGVYIVKVARPAIPIIPTAAAMAEDGPGPGNNGPLPLTSSPGSGAVDHLCLSGTIG